MDNLEVNQCKSDFHLYPVVIETFDPVQFNHHNTFSNLVIIIFII